MIKRVLAGVVLIGVALGAPAYAQEDPNFCYTGWYELDRIQDEQDPSCDRVYFHCDMTNASVLEYRCGGGGGDGILY